MPAPATPPVLTRFACLRCCCVGCSCAAATLMRLAVVCLSMLASASVVACLLLFNVSGGSDSLSASAGALAGVSSVTHADRLAGLRGVCLLVVSRALKTQVIGCSWIARSVSVVALRVFLRVPENVRGGPQHNSRGQPRRNRAPSSTLNES